MSGGRDGQGRRSTTRMLCAGYQSSCMFRGRLQRLDIFSCISWAAVVEEVVVFGMLGVQFTSPPGQSYGGQNIVGLSALMQSGYRRQWRPSLNLRHMAAISQLVSSLQLQRTSRVKYRCSIHSKNSKSLAMMLRQERLFCHRSKLSLCPAP